MKAKLLKWLSAAALALCLCAAAQAAPDFSGPLIQRGATLDRLGQQFQQQNRGGGTLSGQLQQNLDRWRFDEHQRREWLGDSAVHADQPQSPALKLDRQRLQRERVLRDLQPPDSN